MKKITKSLMTLALLVEGVVSANAAKQIDGGIGNLTVPNTYENIGAWEGIYSGGFNYGEDGGKNWAGEDWSAYDYVWIKYSGFTGNINFGVTYSEFVADHGSWGEFKGESTSLSGTSGIVGIKLDNTSVYVKGTAAEDGSFKGDVYAKHIREIWIQAYQNGSGVTIDELWVGSEADYMEAIGFDTNKNHMLLFNNGAAGANPWDHQANYTLPTPLTKDKTYVFEAIINAVNGGETRLVPNGDGAQYLDTKGLWTNEFTRYKVEFKASGNHTKLEIDLGPCAGEVYFENVSLVEKGETTNLIANGDFEALGTTGWSAVNNSLQQAEKELGEIQEPGVRVSVGEAGWKTFRTGPNMQISDSNVKAYVAKYVAEGKCVQLTEVTAVPSWQPVLIEAPQGDYLLKSPASVESFPGDQNDLKANGGSALPGDGTLYGLAKKDGVVGFYKISTSSEVPAWAIYLEIPKAAAEGREFIGFASDATTVKAIETLKQNGAIYNLAGQQIKNAQKGIFIIDGKKVIK
jgi:hypothetical protein